MIEAGPARPPGLGWRPPVTGHDVIASLSRIRFDPASSGETRSSRNHVWGSSPATAEHDSRLVSLAVRALLDLDVETCSSSAFAARLALADPAIAAACAIAESTVMADPRTTSARGVATIGWIRLVPLDAARRSFGLCPVAVMHTLRGTHPQWGAVLHTALIGVDAGLRARWRPDAGRVPCRNAKSWHEAGPRALSEVDQDVRSGRLVPVPAENPEGSGAPEGVEHAVPMPVVSPMAVREKPDGSLRVIVDASQKRDGGRMHGPNGLVDTRQLGFPDMTDARALAKQLCDAVAKQPERAVHSLAMVADLKRAFRSLALGVGSYPSARLHDGRQLLQDRAVQMGGTGSASPMARASQAIVSAVRHDLGEVVLAAGAFIDDLVFVVSDEAAGARALARMTQIVNSLHLSLSAHKLQPPSRAVTYLGLRLERLDGEHALSGGWVASITDDKRATLLLDLDRAAAGERFTRTECAALAGRLQFCSLLGPEATWSGHALLQTLYRRGAQLRGGPRSLSAPAQISARNTKRLLSGPLARHVPMDWLDPTRAAETLVYLDSSSAAFGGVIVARPPSGPGGTHRPPFVVVYMGRWPVTQRSSVIHELLGFIVFVLRYGRWLRGRRVRVMCDNMSVVSTGRGVRLSRVRDSRIPQLMALLADRCAMTQGRFQFSHIPGKDNVAADILSRWWTRPGPSPPQERVRRDVQHQLASDSSKDSSDPRWTNCISWLKTRGISPRAAVAAIRSMHVVDPRRWQAQLWPSVEQSPGHQDEISSRQH